MAITENCHQWLSLLLCALLVLQTKAIVSPLIFPEKAKAMGAVCLDGSPPAYQFVQGTSENKDNWLIYMEGGAWCENIEECKYRTTEHKGSSKHMMKNYQFPGDKDFEFNGMLNPDDQGTEFSKWNIVIMRYCDGSSFTGDVEQPVDNLYFRGKRIFEVKTNEVLNKGMKDAKQVFLTGGSAGGVSVSLHCDRFHALLRRTTKFKCLIDGGYFIHVKKDQAEGFESTFKNVVSLHNSTGMLPQTCTEKMKDKPYLCMFPQYVVEDMETPVFILMSSYDAHQTNVSMHEGFEAVNTYFHNHDKHTTVPAPLYEGLKNLRLQLLDALPTKPSTGIFINNCFFHTEIASPFWNVVGIQVNNVGDAKAISDWYFDERKTNLIEKTDLIKDCYSNGYLAS